MHLAIQQKKAWENFSQALCKPWINQLKQDVRGISRRPSGDTDRRCDGIYYSVTGGERLCRVSWTYDICDRAGPAAKIWRDVGCSIGSSADLMGFQSPLLGGGINLAEVVDAGIGLGGGAGFDEVGNRDCRQEADDGHDDHDLNERKAALAVVFHCLHLYFLLVNRGVNNAPGGLL
jgi:hypothetical protein